MEEYKKPITVIRGEFIAALTDLINNSGLPPFVVEPILKDFYADVKLAAERQYKNDLNEFNRMTGSN